MVAIDHLPVFELNNFGRVGHLPFASAIVSVVMTPSQTNVRAYSTYKISIDL